MTPARSCSYPGSQSHDRTHRTKACRYRSRASVDVYVKHKNGENITFVALTVSWVLRRTSLSISGTADPLEFSFTQQKGG